MPPRASCAVPLSLLLITTPAAAADDAVDFAASLIGRPYVWGAEGPRSFDCSGLTQFVYGKFGIELPRRAISQSRIGEPAGRLRRGDLVFFSTDTRRSVVTHVGIYEGGGMMIDASQRAGRVRRDDLNDGFWTERFMFARRITDAGTGEDPVPSSTPGRPGTERRDRSKVTIQVLERLADVLLRRPRR
jgi:hypothetical protein